MPVSITDETLCVNGKPLSCACPDGHNTPLDIHPRLPDDVLIMRAHCITDLPDRPSRLPGGGMWLNRYVRMALAAYLMWMVQPVRLEGA